MRAKVKTKLQAIRKKYDLLDRPLCRQDFDTICEGEGIEVIEMPLRINGFFYRMKNGWKAIALNSGMDNALAAL